MSYAPVQCESHGYDRTSKNRLGCSGGLRVALRRVRLLTRSVLWEVLHYESDGRFGPLG